MQTFCKQWLGQLEALCGAAQLPHVDVLVDQAGWGTSVLPTLAVIHPPVPWFSLFSDTPEEALLDNAPILMRLDLREWRHKAWLEELAGALWETARLMVVISPLAFTYLGSSLRWLSQFEWAGEKGLLRFYDSRIWPTLLDPILAPADRERFLRLALYWGWVDRDRQACWLPGSFLPGQPLPEKEPPLQLTDAQLSQLGCIGDAQMLLPQAQERFPEFTVEACFETCYRVALTAERAPHYASLAQYANSCWPAVTDE